MKAIFRILVVLPSVCLADEVYLKDAGTITGRIVKQTDTTVEVDVGGGVMGVPMERVARIERGRCALDDYEDRAAKLSPKDVEGWKKLGRFAAEQGLSAQSREAYERVLKLAPNDAEANGAMGLVQLEGRWVTEDESYRARGYVPYEGEWMTPAEMQAAQAEAAAERQRRDAEQRAIAAEIAASEAQARAKEAEERARKAEEQRYNAPIYWGGYGYGVAAWPSQPAPAPTFTPWSEIRRMPR